MIVLLHGAPAFGAVEQYVLDVAGGLRDAGIEAAIVHADVPALEPFREIGGSVRSVPIDVDVPVPVLVARLRSAVRTLDARVVHVTDVWPAATLGARLAGVRRLIVTHHTPELPRHDNVVGRVVWQLSWMARPLVVYTSEADRRSDGRRFLRSVVIPLGIDVDRFSSAVPVRNASGPAIGNVARLAEQKGHRYLIEAAPEVLARRPDARFVLVGDGELREELERLARERGVREAFEFTGHRDDVPDLLASFDVFAFPSLFEGQCLAVIEAQAAGVPVVATPVGGIVESVVDGESGLLCAPRDAHSLADGIVRLLEDDALTAAIRERAAAQVRQRYDVRRMIERTLALYR